MRLAIRACPLALVLVLLMPRPAGATPREDLTAARAAFQLGDFKETIVLLTPNLYPDRRFGSPAEIIEAHVLVGVSYFKLGQRERAALEFEEALFIDSELTLDPLFYSEDVREFFDDKKRRIQEELRAAEEQRKLAEQNEQLMAALKNARLVERRPYFINFVPFGAGQFQNKQNTKGTFFLVSEVALGGASVSLFAAQLIEFGFPLEVPEEDASRVRAMQVAQITTGGLFLAVAIWGVVDALVHWEPTKVTQIDLSKELLRSEPEASLRLVPTAGPGWAGASLSFEF